MDGTVTKGGWDGHGKWSKTKDLLYLKVHQTLRTKKTRLENFFVTMFVFVMIFSFCLKTFLKILIKRLNPV